MQPTVLRWNMSSSHDPPWESLIFYGPDHQLATKLVCGVIAYEGAEPEVMEKWFSKTDVRHSESVLAEVLGFIEACRVKTVSMAEQILGCPHEEGIDYRDDRLAFPFEAECSQALSVSPLKAKACVTVTAMADQICCDSTMLVQVQWQACSLAVPLSQLDVGSDAVDEVTVDAIGDWHYWVEQRYRF